MFKYNIHTNSHIHTHGLSLNEEPMLANYCNHFSVVIIQQDVTQPIN